MNILKHIKMAEFIECPVCIETVKRSSSCMCAYCTYTTCASCAKKYLCNISSDPNCMNCKKDWNTDFLQLNFTKHWRLGKYKTHRESVLYDREVALMQATQPYVEREIANEKAQAKMQKLRNKIRDLQNEIVVVSNTINRTNSKKIETIFEYVGRCSSNGCNGFISTKYKCGICDIKYCKECMECITDDDHVCKEDVLATHKLMVKDTRACPNCAIPIYKISGCNQMFCTMCKIVFCFRTGAIERNRNAVHNPHYFTYLQTLGANAANPNANADDGAGACLNAVEVAIQHVYMATGRAPTKHKQNEQDLETLRLYGVVMIHIYRVMLPYYETKIHNGHDLFQRNFELRVKFFRNMVDEKKFRFDIQKNEKAYNKNQDIRDILDALVNTCATLIITSAPEYLMLQDRMTSLFEMSKTSLSNIADKYSCKVPDLDTIVQQFVVM